MWTAACLTDPSLTYQRVELTKPIAMVYVIDDMFDVFGTLDELTLFTNAVNRYVCLFHIGKLLNILLHFVLFHHLTPIYN